MILEVNTYVYTQIMIRLTSIEYIPLEAIKHTELNNMQDRRMRKMLSENINEGRAVVLWKNSYPAFIIKPLMYKIKKDEQHR